MSNLNSSSMIPGIPSGIYYGQYSNLGELNSRITERQFSDVPLLPNFDPRPTPTKYGYFPIVDLRPISKVNIIPQMDHYVELNFNPGTNKGPPSGYYNNIDLETNLRNLGTALQHGAAQGVYIPSSTSDLYNVHVYGRQCEQPYPGLFTKPIFENSYHPNINQTIGSDIFFNNTRTQLRNSYIDQK